MGNLLSEIRVGVLAIGVLLLTIVALQVKKIFVKRMSQKRVLAPSALEMMGKGFTIFILLISGMIILQILGIDMVPLLTFSGIGAAILGFASKDVVANFFGGWMIYLTRPFNANDTIELPGKKIMGVVEEIGWYLTTIRDLQKKTLYIPNSLFSTELLFNHSRMTHRRIEEQIRFRITDPEEAHRLVEQIRQIIQGHSEIDHREPLDVFLLSISPYGIVIEIKAYTKTTQYPKFMEIKQDLLLKIHKI